MSIIPSGGHSAQVTAIGSYVPDRVLTNSHLEKMVDTNHEWIIQRTGIHERRIAAAEQFTSHLCYAAIDDLIARYKIELHDVDYIIICTHTPDYAFPSVASQVQAHFKIAAAGAIDMNAGCSGFVYGLQLAYGLIAAGLQRKILVVASDTLSKITDYTDRSTCILFGDGAGAMLVERTELTNCILGHYSATDGAGGKHLYRSGLSGQMAGEALSGAGKLVQNGREVYRWAVSTVPDGMKQLADRSGMELEDYQWFVPHSANMRMIESICEKSGYPLEQTLTSLSHYGNTSAASIPLSIDLAVRANRISAGDRLLLYGFGAGLVHAGISIEWSLS